MHELLAEIVSEISLSGTNELENNEIETDSESALLVNSTSVNIINPGDIRELIYVPGKAKAISNKKENMTAFINEVSMNSNTYRGFGQHVTCCTISSL